MDFHGAMETFAEAWVAATSQVHHHLQSAHQYLESQPLQLLQKSPHSHNSLPSPHSGGISCDGKSPLSTPSPHNQSSLYNNGVGTPHASSHNNNSSSNSNNKISNNSAMDTNAALKPLVSSNSNLTEITVPSASTLAMLHSHLPPPPSISLHDSAGSPHIGNNFPNNSVLPNRPVSNCRDACVDYSSSSTIHHDSPVFPVGLNSGLNVAARQAVEAAARIQDQRTAGFNGPPPCSAKAVPLHCVIEQTKIRKNGEADSVVDLDTYAILPGNTLFCEVVRTALIKLGYTAVEAMGAKAVINVKNWKSLTFDQITENTEATIEDILGELTTVSTLKIKLCSALDGVQWNDKEVKTAVIELLKTMSQLHLSKMSPLSQSTISNIANSKYKACICPQKCAEFGIWYRRFKLNTLEASQFCDKSTRQTFHPVFELPRMREWYSENPAPSEKDLQEYSQILNEGHIRRQRPKITPVKMRIWWRNERQRQKRMANKMQMQLDEESYQLEQKYNVSVSTGQAIQLESVFPEPKAVKKSKSSKNNLNSVNTNSHQTGGNESDESLNNIHKFTSSNLSPTDILVTDDLPRSDDGFDRPMQMFKNNLPYS